MKKFSIVLVAFFAIISEIKAQTISVNAFGGYGFDDKLYFNNADATIKGGFMWGVSAEGISPSGGALELLYQYQSTSIPVYAYTKAGHVLLNPDNTDGVISYLLLNGIQYFHVNPTAEPYAGLGSGVAFVSANAGNSSTKFALDFKGGVKIKVNHALAFKVGAQLLSSVQQSGTSYYYYYGAPYAYATYTSIWQFGFTGGVTFDFGGH
jgi:opacity protein-like surface antigen